MDRETIKKTLKKPFETPWTFFIATIVLVVLAHYFLQIYGVIHWKLLPFNYRISSNLEDIIRDTYKETINEQDMTELLSTCVEDDWKHFDELIKSFGYIDTEVHENIRRLCYTLFMSEDIKRHGLKLLNKTFLYFFFGFFGFVSSVTCFIVSVKSKRVWIGIIALIFGLLGGYTSMVFM